MVKSGDDRTTDVQELVPKIEKTSTAKQNGQTRADYRKTHGPSKWVCSNVQPLARINDEQHNHYIK